MTDLFVNFTKNHNHFKLLRDDAKCDQQGFWGVIFLADQVLPSLRNFLTVGHNNILREKNSCKDSAYLSEHARKLFESVLTKHGIQKEVSRLSYTSIIHDHVWSLSHTAGASLCGLVNALAWPQVAALGVDIEQKDRKIIAILKDQLFNPNDINLEPIVCWVCKEAIFKAISKVYDDSFDLKHIILEEHNFYLNLNKKIKGIYDYWVEDNFILSGGVILR